MPLEEHCAACLEPQQQPPPQRGWPQEGKQGRHWERGGGRRLTDAAIQTELIRDPRVSKKQAGELAKRGANPTIRQNAQSWFQDKKAWK